MNTETKTDQGLPRWLPDVGYVLFALVLFSPVIFGGRVFIARDLLHYYFPLGVKIHRAFSGTGSFLWDSGVDSGLPMIARYSTMVFYPATLLHAIFAADVAIAAGVIVHLPVAASATMRLALRYTSSRAAAWAAGLGFAFGGYVLSMVGGVLYLYGAALLPLSLLALHRLVEAPGPRRAAALACVIALQIFAADLQTLFCEVVFLFPLVLTARTSGRPDLVRAGGWAAAAAAVAACVAACQLLPTIEFVGLSTRASGIPLSDAGEWSFHPVRAVEMLVPGFFGGSLPTLTFWAGVPVGNSDLHMPWALAVHTGALLSAVGLAALPFGERSARKALLLWGGAAVFFLLLAFGTSTPIFGAFHHFVPGAGRFRYPEKFILFACLGFTMLGSRGLGRLFRDTDGGPAATTSPARNAIAVLLGLFALLVAARIFFAPEIAGRAAWFSDLLRARRMDVDPGAALSATASAIERAGVIALLLAAVVALRRWMRPGLFVAALLAISAVDLGTAAVPLMTTEDRRIVREPPPVCAYLRQREDGFAPTIWRSNHLVYGDNSWVGADMASIRRRDVETLFGNLGNAWCANYAKGHEAARLQQYADLLKALGRQGTRYNDVLGVEYVLARPEDVGTAGYPLVAYNQALNMGIYRNDPLPYAQAVGRVESARGGPEAIARVSDPTFDYRTTAVLEGLAAPAAHPEARRDVRILTRQPGRATLEVRFDEPGFLVVRESDYPGWRAMVDDREVRIRRANAAFLGIEIPPGAHSVSFEFAPPIQRLGFGVSVAGASLLLLLAAAPSFMPRLRNRSRAAGSAGLTNAGTRSMIGGS